MTERALLVTARPPRPVPPFPLGFRHRLQIRCFAVVPDRAIAEEFNKADKSEAMAGGTKVVVLPRRASGLRRSFTGSDSGLGVGTP